MAVFLTIAIVLLMSVALYISFNKTDSTTGRKFILQQSFNLIKKHPLLGYGHNGFQREYMLQQANFFKENPNSKYENNADEVRYPMNEFVYLWINYGMGAPIMLAIFFIFPFVLFLHRKGRMVQETLLPLVSVIIFSLFSYPFHYQSSWLVMFLIFSPVFHIISLKIPLSFKERVYSIFLVGLFLLLYLSIDIYKEYQWRMAEKISFRGFHKEALDRYGDLYGYFHDNRFFLYSYALAAFMGGDMRTSYNIINESGRYWNGYARELLFGDVCLYLHEYDEATVHFSEAHYMCPVRFAPLEGLYKVYKVTEQNIKKDSIAEIIAAKSVKISSSDVERIKETCK